MDQRMTRGHHIVYPAWPLPNVHLGVSCENHAPAAERIPHLLDTPAAVRWISAEPLIGYIGLIDLSLRGGLDWVVVGGESGPGARPCDLSWIRNIVEQCYRAAVPAFVKQLGRSVRGVWGCGPAAPRLVTRDDNHDVYDLKDKKGGDMDEWPFDLRVREYPESRRTA
jgi:protein gp37